MRIYEYESDRAELFKMMSSTLFTDTPASKVIVYDIATTSFEAANGCVFLIGTAYLKEGKLMIKQFFSEDITEEPDMLKSFFKFCDNFGKIVSYKGDSFDIPYIAGRIGIFEKDGDKILSSVVDTEALTAGLNRVREKSVDLYDYIKILKPAIGLVSTKQDYLQKLVGQRLTQKVSGENVCHFYVRHLAENKLKMLSESVSSHNADGFISGYIRKDLDDDLAHIEMSDNTYYLQDLLSSNADSLLAVMYMTRLGLLFNIVSGRFDINIISDDTQKEKISIEYKFDTDNLQSSVIKIDLNIFDKVLKGFYTNYRDYYYFPLEDTAIHKSVAEFTPSSSRKKATPQTAYCVSGGIFIHVPKSYYNVKLTLGDGLKVTDIRYRESFESEENFYPLSLIMNLPYEKQKEFAFHIFLEYAREHLSDLLISL